VERIPRVVSVLEELRAAHQLVTEVQAGVRPLRELERRARAHAADEGPVHRVGERVQEGQPPRPREERLLRRVPVARVPVPLEEVLRRSEEHTSELQSLAYLVCRLLLEKKKTRK